jgi:hypothetical protein
MRRLSLAFFILFILILVFFTFFGNMIYDKITPGVSSFSASSSYQVNETTYIRIPREAVADGGVIYEIVSERAFSREIFTLRTLKIEYTETLFDWDEGDAVYVYKGLSSGTRVLRTPDSSLGDGSRVRLTK